MVIISLISLCGVLPPINAIYYAYYLLPIMGIGGKDKAMVDILYGSGITDIIHELPHHVSVFKKYASIKLLKAKPAIYGSVDVNNVCNLHCSHCYWWLNRKNDSEDLSAQDWRRIIKNTFKKQQIFVVTLVGGEPTMRPDIIEVFCEEMPRRICVVTNGTFPLRRFEKLYFYWFP